MLHSLDTLTVVNSITVKVNLTTGQPVVEAPVFFVVECAAGVDADSAVIALRRDGASAYAERDNGVNYIITNHKQPERFINSCCIVGTR